MAAQCGAPAKNGPCARPRKAGRERCSQHDDDDEAREKEAARRERVADGGRVAAKKRKEVRRRELAGTRGAAPYADAIRDVELPPPPEASPLAGIEIATVEGRRLARLRVIELVALGVLSHAEGSTIHQLINAHARERAGNDRRGRIVVNFRTVRSRAEAEAATKEREEREAAS